MFSSSVLAVSHHPQVRRLVTTNSASRRLVGRFVAGDDLDTAMAPIHALVGPDLGQDVDEVAGGPGAFEALATLGIAQLPAHHGLLRIWHARHRLARLGG